MPFTPHKQKPFTLKKKYFVTDIFYLDLSTCVLPNVEIRSPFCFRGGTCLLYSGNVPSLSLQLDHLYTGALR
jgi:hypothetical protein